MAHGPTIDDVTERSRLFRGRDVTASLLSGGHVNRAYVVQVNETRYVVRIPGVSSELLVPDRADERHDTVAAAASGVSPRVVEYLDDWQVMILEYVEGETLTDETIALGDRIPRVAATLRTLHAGPRFRSDFDMFRTAERYLAVVDERDIAIPAGYREHLAALPRIEAALNVNPLASVPCHNDLLADNYLDDGERLWLVDWEYSGNNDPTFELGNTAQELGYDDAQISELCAAYFGGASPALLARMRLQMIMSDVGWTLWAAIQAAISSIDYDFWGWAEERWARASSAFARDDFDDLLAEAVGG